MYRLTNNTTPRRSSRRAAAVANARLAAMRPGGTRSTSTAGVSSATRLVVSAEDNDALAVADANSVIMTPERGAHSNSITGARSAEAETVSVEGNDASASNCELSDEDSLNSDESSVTDLFECCICFEEPRANNIATLNGCNHEFCLDCVTEWAETNNVCPLCRAPFQSIESNGVLQQVPDRLAAVEEARLERLHRLLEQARAVRQEAIDVLDDALQNEEEAADIREEALRCAHSLASIMDTEPPSPDPEIVEELRARVDRNVERSQHLLTRCRSNVERGRRNVERAEQNVTSLSELLTVM